MAALPWSTLKTPAGNPASLSSSPRRTETDGSRSDGFKMTTLPVASALAVIHRGTMIGKLNGVMAATTPSDSRKECTSTPSATCEEKPPFKCSVTPQAYSTFSRPRAISPLASAMVLPCSDVISAASSSVWVTSKWRNVKRMLVRCERLELRHVCHATRAPATASSTTCVEGSGTRAVTSPVAGL